MEYLRGHDATPANDTEASENTSHVLRAKQLVVLSGGAFGSPAILERSGIGGKEVLQKVGVKQIIDLPGVGENYQGWSQFILAKKQ